MKEPVRLWADPEAPADLRVDLHRAAKAQATFDAEAGLARLLVAAAAVKTAAEVAAAGTGAANAAGAGGATAAGGATTSKGLALLLGKGAYWALAAVGTASVVAAVSLGRGGDRPALATAASAPIAAATHASAEPVPAVQASAEPSASAPAEQPVTMGEIPKPPAQPVATGEPSRSPGPKPAVTMTPKTAGLTEEIQQVAAMRNRLRDRPADVLAEADRGARSFPDGVLAQEREALAIEALVRLGRDEEARARAAAFAARYPTSPLAARMRALTSR